MARSAEGTIHVLTGRPTNVRAGKARLDQIDTMSCDRPMDGTATMVALPPGTAPPKSARPGSTHETIRAIWRATCG
jgi:hypothetical protein